MRRGERGFVALLSLASIALLLALSISLSAMVQAEKRMAYAYFDETRAMALAFSGISRGLALIQESYGQSFVEDIPRAASNDLDLPDGRFAVSTTPENSRLNVNTASADQLKHLPEMNDAWAEAIIQARERQGEKIHTLAQILALGGARQDSFFSMERATPAELEVTEVNQQHASLSELLTAITPSGEDGKISINTAPQVVLETVPHLTAQAVSSIIMLRDERPFRNISELSRVPGLSPQEQQRLTQFLTVKSSIFRVESTGTIQAFALRGRERRKRITALVDAREKPFKILYWHESP